MKIERIKVFHVPLPYGTLGRTRLKLPEVTLQDTVVAIETDQGLTGWGESCPLMPTYLPASAGGLRAALELLCPPLIGQDPRHLGTINDLMDATMLAHGHAKAALDMACWDILGKATAMPLSGLLGGARCDGTPVYDSIPLDDPAAMVETVKQRRSIGIRIFQVKLGDEAEADIERMQAIAAILHPGETMVCDANRGWTMADARRVVMAADALDPALALLIEQPCATYEECLTVRRMCRRPLVLDEVIDDMGDLLRAIADDALDVLVVKLSHAGGISKARELSTVAQRSGIRLRIEDTVGAEFVRAAVAHLAATIAPRMLLASYPHPASIALGASDSLLENGVLRPGSAPGLGVDPDLGFLAAPAAVYD